MDIKTGGKLIFIHSFFHTTILRFIRVKSKKISSVSYDYGRVVPELGTIMIHVHIIF